MADYPRKDLLLSPEELAAILDEPDVRVIDTRGAGRFAEGHLPNAINLPVARLDDPSSRTAGALLPPDRFSAMVGNLGIGNDDLLVFYDDGPSLMGARAFWVFDHYGHERMAVLNGGLAAWVTGQHELVRDLAEFEKKEYAANPIAERLANKSDVQERLGKAGTVLLDARSTDEYTGAVAQASRGGHIPGAKHLEWSSTVRPERVPMFKDADEIGALIGATGAAPDNELITYCQSGARSSHLYFTLRLMGFDNVRNYSGSWGDWGNDPSMPVE